MPPVSSRRSSRLTRAQSFFGVHFDFHASPNDREIGHRPVGPGLENLLRRVRPDYVQCDCKGHSGWSSYPTNIGPVPPGLKGDPLQVWRKITAQHGVSLYMHFSGVYDRYAVKAHPAWARLDENGQRDPKNTSVFSSYVDRSLIPQMRELRETYGVDGFWIDGECWAVDRDYSPRAIKQFQKETGIRRVPRGPADPHYFEFSQFCREAFRRYVRQYVDEMHRLSPGVEITSNWIFSSLMPEPVTIDVDFLSGDLNQRDSLNSARIEARCLMHQGKPWDLMSWSYCSALPDVCNTTKPAVQLQREAATVISLGGGFQMYFQQRRDGTIREQHLGLIEEVSAFSRARQPFCHQAESIPQVAVLYSTTGLYRRLKKLFAPWNGETEGLLGTCLALLDNQFHVDLLSEHHLTKRTDRYPLIVVPEWDCLDEHFREELLHYVQRGGKLLVTGAQAVPLFAKELGIRVQGAATNKCRWLAANGAMFGLASEGLDIVPGPHAQVCASWHASEDLESPAYPAAVTRSLGRGQITGLALDFGARYRLQKTSQARNIFGVLVRQLLPNPLVKLEGSHDVNVVLMKKNGKLMVNLLNVSGSHDNKECYTFDEIVPLGPLKLEILTRERPRYIRLQPEGRTLPFRWVKGKAVLSLPRLEIHSILEVG